MSDTNSIETVNPLPPNHALYGVPIEIITTEDEKGLQPRTVRFGEYGEIHFQAGPIQEYGVNGIGIEHLLNVVAIRLRGYQETDFKCRENALALTKVEEALHWLGARTADRQARGVEGTSTV